MLACVGQVTCNILFPDANEGILLAPHSIPRTPMESTTSQNALTPRNMGSFNVRVDRSLQERRSLGDPRHSPPFPRAGKSPARHSATLFLTCNSPTTRTRRNTGLPHPLTVLTAVGVPILLSQACSTYLNQTWSSGVRGQESR